MSTEVKSLPNDKIAIICHRYSNDNNTYTIIPQSISVGRTDENLNFISEDGKYCLKPIDKVENITDASQEVFYIYCDSFDSLSQAYGEKDMNKLLVKYYMEIASNMLLALVDGDTVHIYAQDYSKISPEIKGYVSKHYEESNIAESHVAINKDKNDKISKEADLDHIDKEDLARFLKSHILKNDALIDDLATIIAMNYSAKSPEEVTSTISVGTTGSGKTETFHLISQYLGVPFTMFDASSLSATGFQGNSVVDICRLVVQNSGGDIERAKKSIVVLEEIDKIADRGHGVSDIDVQYELLKFLDGITYRFSLDSNNSQANQVCLDTSFMTKTALGAFEEIFVKKKKEQFHMGFNNQPDKKDIIITDKDLVAYGLNRQFVRRFLVMLQYKELTREDLYEILSTSKSSPLLLRKNRYLRDFNTILEYTEDYLEAIVEYALTLEAGAGGLKKGVIKSLIKAESALYNRSMTQDKSLKRLRVTGETVSDPCKFTY